MKDSLAVLVASPHLVDVILVFTVVEAVGLFWLRRRASRSWHPGGSVGVMAICLMLLPGIFLMLAIRTALAGATWPWLPAALAAALVAHGLDLRSRWRG